MKNERFKLHLKPSSDGSLTKLRLRGSVVTALPPCELRRLLTLLTSWSGESVELVLPVDVGTAAWFELWCYAISETPERHLKVRFVAEHTRSRKGGARAAR